MRFSTWMVGYFFVVWALWAGSAFGQNQPTLAGPQEFIESSSPSRSGGRVISRYVPGASVQTRTTVAQNIGQPIPVAANPNSRTPTLADPNTARSSQDTALRTQQNATTNRGPTVGYSPNATPNLAQPSSEARLAQIAQLQNHQFNRVAQNCVCNGQQQTGYQPTAPTLQLPSLQTPRTQSPQQVLGNIGQVQTNAPIPTAAAQPPSLTFGTGRSGVNQLQFPQPPIGTAATGSFAGGIFQNSNIGVPQLSTGSTFGSRLSNWWKPLTTGTGAYVPVVRLQNMQPGVYVGQGIIGQAKAYVDGQPIRNLFRYISP